MLKTISRTTANHSRQNWKDLSKLLRDLGGSLQNHQILGDLKIILKGFKLSFQWSCRVHVRCFSNLPSSWRFFEGSIRDHWVSDPRGSEQELHIPHVHACITPTYTYRHTYIHNPHMSSTHTYNVFDDLWTFWIKIIKNLSGVQHWFHSWQMYSL